LKTGAMASNEECVARLFLEPNRLQLDRTRAPNNLANDELPEIRCIHFVRYAGARNNESLIKSSMNLSDGEPASN
jgi:hypothetical protein